MKQGNLFDQSSNNTNFDGIRDQQFIDQFQPTNSNNKNIDTGLGELIFLENGLTNNAATRLLEYLTENNQNLPISFNWKNTPMDSASISAIKFTTTKWKQDHIKMFGKDMPLPRLTSWYGDPGMNYTYSGIPCQPNPWNKGLAWLKEKAEALAEHQFNSALLNWYRDGSDKLSWHADDEKELGKNPTIASVSLGETRDFILRKKDDHSSKLKFALSHGSILIMKGELQEHWEHSVPARTRVTKSRINITFRTIY